MHLISHSVCISTLRCHACRECIIAEIETRHKCPVCRKKLTAEGLREGVMPAEDDADAQAGQIGAAYRVEEVAGPSMRRHPGAYVVLFESKLNVLLNEVALFS